VIHIAQFVFVLSGFLIAYTYALYPAVLFCIYSIVQINRDWNYLTARRNRRQQDASSEQLPAVTLIVPAYNEEDCLAAKIRNILEIQYPPEKLEVIFVSDGSTDRTNEILSASQYPCIRKLLLPERKGKAHALNVAVSEARNELLILSDASTIFAPDAVQKLARHFSDSNVGAVCGAIEFQRTAESVHTEGVYWNYEGMLRLMEARIGATLTASGALYALRKAAFQPLSALTIIEDFVIPMNARRLGYSVLYDPEATAVEFAANSVGGEFTRRVRLAVGSFRALKSLLTTRMDGFTLMAFVSHKLLRWILPFVLIALLASNGALVNYSPLFFVLFCGQLLFYVWACLGFLFRQQLKQVPGALIGYFILAMNMAFLVGFVRVLTGKGKGTWQRVSQPNPVVGR
jgi:cellulose synthase/poly-beta-1,6-N-acetylglucosamine synthase-like glycosyltransferase